eukprot:CAMPEP_0181048806 /NCGR_PEP_ID=MMETSP1070-20121207/15633_1 /TAXON_ID=265543 /ORGANISM="Minutocellus polymorphus, Strain NH13" /LENGTH=329 /DNA_ID=CAMNT_0023127617 /DNA_START=263 /DNA_END=1252 /DNA_ORIENTATION=-
MGTLHVLTGPDHLSALATLSANVGNCAAFSLGVQWGLGHSTGLIIVGSALIAASDSGAEEVVVPELLSKILESVVGVFMLLLGMYGVTKAIRKRRMVGDDPSTLPLTKDDLIDGDENDDDASIALVPIKKSRNKSAEDMGKGSSYDGSGGEQDDKDDVASTSDEKAKLHINKGEPSMSLADVDDSKAAAASLAPSVDKSFGSYISERMSSILSWFQGIRLFSKTYSPRLIALAVGIVHGVAGPGGILGVIPAVHLQDWKLAAVYLGTFCITSTLAMGSFAALYGSFSAKISDQTHLEFQLECFSAALSIIVGVIWLTLIFLGKLEDFFP